MHGRILVTGAGGFIGSHIAKHLAACSLDVIAHCRSATAVVPKAKSNLRIVRGSLIDNPLDNIFEPFEAIVHCAAAAGPWHTPEALLQDNIIATGNLCYHAIRWKTKAFIYLSSTSIYGEITDPVLTEETRYNRPDVYGQSKLKAEGAVADLSEWVPSVALRLPGVIGAGAHEKNWLPRVARSILNDEPVTAFNLGADFNAAVHVADLASFIETLLHSPWRGFTAVNLAAGDWLSVRDVIERLAHDLGHPVKIVEGVAGKSPYLISIEQARRLGYVPLPMGEMIDRFAGEVSDAAE